MLKYEINARKAKANLEPIEVSQYLIDDYDENSNILICNCLKDLKFGPKTKIVCINSSFYIEPDSLLTYDFKGSKEFDLLGYDAENKTFSILYDKYADLPITYITHVVPEDTNESSDISSMERYLFRLSEIHQFNIAPDSAYRFYIHLKKADGWYVKDFIIGDTIKAVNEDGSVTETLPDNVDGYVTDGYTVAVSAKSINDKFGIKELSSYYLTTDAETQAQFEVFTRISASRDDLVFNEIGSGFTLYAEKVLTSITIPLSRQIGTDLLMDDAIRADFVKPELEKCINPVTEVEKDVYYPVKWATEGFSAGGNCGAMKVEVTEIRFNLHFRERDNDEWTTEPDSMWNGVYRTRTTTNEGDNELPTDTYYIADDFFSYGNKNEQSDLLSYLGFANNDVKYQRNALKKSFLRLSFYDSPYPQKQSLLAYSTIYFNTGNAFAKYLRNVEADGYKMLTLEHLDGGGTKYEHKDDLVGINTNRERTKRENSEDKRLSSQFSVKGKYDSDASSDGFYLYLWKDNESGIVPTDIYMKVEFNHAGYGRTIPFMMPYKDKGGGVKSFKEVVDDWGYKDGVVYGYDMDEYQKYSYIRMKYKYDKVGKRHVYYLDDEVYGKGVSDENEVLTLNLYEAKVGEKQGKNNNTGTNSDS